MNKLKVPEFGEDLNERNKNTRGNKPWLKERFLDALAKNVPLVENQDRNIVDNTAGKAFDNHTYWDLIRNKNVKYIPDKWESMVVE